LTQAATLWSERRNGARLCNDGSMPIGEPIPHPLPRKAFLLLYFSASVVITIINFKVRADWPFLSPFELLLICPSRSRSSHFSSTLWSKFKSSSGCDIVPVCPNGQTNWFYRPGVFHSYCTLPVLSYIVTSVLVSMCYS